MPNYFFNITGRLIDRLVLLIAGLALIGMSACEAIFERDISGDTLNLIIPTNNDTSQTNEIHFKWDELKGASYYNLQIVQPSFASINTFILDSNVTGDEFFVTLDPGNYQFQIRGENSAYQSLWTGPYNLVVDSVSDLTNQTVPLIAPANLMYSNDPTFTFSWQSLYAAETYEFQLRAGADFSSSGTVLHSASSIYGTSYSTPTGLFSSEGAYAWGVKAMNLTSASDFSDRTLYIDLTLPNSPLSASPAHGASFADTVVLKWNTAADIGTIQSPVSRIVQIASDTLFGSITQTYTTSTDSIQLVFASAGTYWWRVYTLDQAGNMCTNFSAHRKIIIP